MLRTLASRLTFFYLLLFCFLALIIFLIIDTSMQHYLLNDVDEELHNETVEFTNLLKTGGLAALKQQILVEDDSEDIEEVFIRIFSVDRQLVFATDLAPWPVLPGPSWNIAPAEEGRLETFSATPYPHPIRIIQHPLANGYVFQMGVRLDDSEELLTHLRQIYISILGVALMLGAICGFYLTRRVLSGLQTVRAAADRISSGDLSEEIQQQAGGEEVDALVESVNHMQQRIKTLIGELQNVTNDIAHDLRSPVTRMRGLAETSLVGEQNEEDFRNLAGAVVEECDSMVGMINTMLDIAETDAGLKPLNLQPMNLAELIEDVSELYSAVAEDKQISISHKMDDQQLCVIGERSRLQRALVNLLDNAIKFTPSGGKVLIEAGNDNDRVSVSIADSGPGISSADLPHVCERHFRADHSRSTPGSGLGLSLVQAIVKAHHGSLQIDSQQGHGTCVTVHLPAAESC